LRNTCVFKPPSLADNLHKDPLFSSPVKLTVEDLLPGPEIEIPLRHSNDNLPPHDLPLQVGVSVILSRPIVEVPGDRLMGGEPFQPFFIVMMESRLIVIDKDRRRYVHGVAQQETFPDPALAQTLIHLRRDIDEPPARGDVKPQFLSVAFYSNLLS